MRYLLPLLLLSAGAVQAEPIDAFKPMAFLAGHCWKGDFADGKTTDVHCFSWLYEGKALRDVHTVRSPGRPDYVGESTYFWDSAAKQVSYVYVENMGGLGRGQVEATPTGIAFPGSQYINGGKTMDLRVQWNRAGDDAYEAWAETKNKDAWVTMYKMVLKRLP